MAMIQASKQGDNHLQKEIAIEKGPREVPAGPTGTWGRLASRNVMRLEQVSEGPWQLQGIPRRLLRLPLQSPLLPGRPRAGSWSRS